MAVSIPPLQPHENRTLLGALQQGRLDADRPKATRAVIDSVLALVAAKVLVATLDGAPAATPAAEGWFLVAVTDSEAAAGYLAALGEAPRAGWLEFRPVKELMDRGPNRVTWTDMLKAAGADAVVVNPAGPLGVSFPAGAIRSARPGLRPRRPPQPDPAWLDPERRAQERERIAELLRLAGAAVAVGSLEQLATIQAQITELNRLQSPFVAAVNHYYAGLIRLRQGALEDGVRQSVFAALWYSRGGFPERCTDTVLELSEWLLAAARDGDAAPQWAQDSLRTATDALAALTRAGLGWRTDEAERFLRASAQVLPAREP